MQKIIIILSFIFAIGCNNNKNKMAEAEKTNSSTQTKPVETTPANDTYTTIKGCYMQVLGRDTFAASLQQQGNMVTGKLSFNNYEKDGSTGTVKGKMEDNILKLYYSFASEGMNSVMEVYFKYEDGKLLRGIGDTGNKSDTSYFTNVAAIKYNGSVLKKIDCTSLPGKYK